MIDEVMAPSRLAELVRYGIVDTAPEAAFNRAVRMAVHLFGTPIALISLVEEKRQWFKARVGLAADETPVEVSFCAHAVRAGATLVVEDAMLDSRFRDNALVTGEPHIRFYAGAPLIVPNGKALGTICIIDEKPRSFSAEEQAALEDLAGIVISELELRLALINAENDRAHSAAHALAYEELSRKNALLAATVSAAPVAIIMIDLTHEAWPVLYTNSAFTALTGYRSDELLGHDCLFLMGPGTDEKAVSDIQAALMSRTRMETEIVLQRKDRSQFTARLMLSLADDGGTDGPVAAAMMLIDVTEERRREAAEQDRQKMEALGALAGGVAHEINNLLQPIYTLPDLIRDVLPNDAHDARQDLAVIEAAGRSAGEIVRNVLLFAKKDEERPSSIDFADGVKAALLFVSSLLPVTVVLDASIPDLGVRVPVSRTRLQQIITNLVLNGVHALSGRGIIRVRLLQTEIRTVEADCLGVQSGAYLDLSIQDHGCGMSDDVKRRIFEPFFTTKAFGEGTGLGLSIAYGIVKSWGGAISVESELGKGSTFHIYIPTDHDSSRSIRY